MLVHVANIETSRIRDPGCNLLSINDGRSWQETAFRTDLDPIWTGQADGCIRSWRYVRVLLCSCQFRCFQSNFTVRTGCRVGNIPLDIEEAVVGSIQHAQAV